MRKPQAKVGGGLALMLAALSSQVGPGILLFYLTTAQCSDTTPGLGFTDCWGNFLLTAASWPFALIVLAVSTAIRRFCNRPEHSELRVSAMLSIVTTAPLVVIGLLWFVGGLIATSGK
jgi:hypothetical protein